MIIQIDARAHTQKGNTARFSFRNQKKKKGMGEYLASASIFFSLLSNLLSHRIFLAFHSPAAFRNSL